MNPVRKKININFNFLRLFKNSARASNGVKKKVFIILLLVILVTPLLALAADNPCTSASISAGVKTALPRCVNQIYVWSLGISVILALLMIVLGGYYKMTARGNAEQSTKGTEYIQAALIGIVLLFGAWLLLNEINPDLVNFPLDSFDPLNQTQSQTTPPCTGPAAPRANCP
jgi:hypothetical protein